MKKLLLCLLTVSAGQLCAEKQAGFIINNQSGKDVYLTVKALGPNNDTKLYTDKSKLPSGQDFSVYGGDMRYFEVTLKKK